VYVNCQRGVIRDPAFLDLLDHPSTFPILWDLMGWNIREPSASGHLTECVFLTPECPYAELYISNVAVLGPEPPSDGEQKAGGAGWHIE